MKPLTDSCRAYVSSLDGGGCEHSEVGSRERKIRPIDEYEFRYQRAEGKPTPLVEQGCAEPAVGVFQDPIRRGARGETIDLIV